MKHLESCVRTAINVRLLREEYNEENPYHCESCEGWGGVVDVVDPYMVLNPDIGEDSLPVDDCSSCIENGKCPRCSSDYNTDQDSDDYDEECSSCGFKLGETEGKPYPHFCFCNELEDNK